MSEKKIKELEDHFIRLLDALMEFEERIASLESSRDAIWVAMDSKKDKE